MSVRSSEWPELIPCRHPILRRAFGRQRAGRFDAGATLEFSEFVHIGHFDLDGRRLLRYVRMIAIPIPIHTPDAPDGPVSDLFFFQVYLFVTP